MKDLIINNPYRVLGVYTNSPLKERVANQNRLNAFAKVGKEVSFPEDFANIIQEKPTRTTESITAATTAINLDRDKLKHSLFWFVKTSVTDDIALKYLQTGNVDKTKEILGKKESFTTLINRGVLAFIEDDLDTGFSCISKVIHTESYRMDLLLAIGVAKLDILESEVAELFITELLKEIPAQNLLYVALNAEDKAIIGKKALETPLSTINAAISVAKAADSKNAQESLSAGTKLMNSTKKALEDVKNIAGVSSVQYQIVADNLAKQILQCGINYYNHAREEDMESPRKAMELQGYALKIAVGKLTKDRCRDNCDTLRKAIADMPPVEVADEVRKIKEELRKFCQLPDKISHAITLINNTKPLLATIKVKLGSANPFYLSLSTRVVGNALHNVIEEVNQAVSPIEKAVRKAEWEAKVVAAMVDRDELLLRTYLSNKEIALDSVFREAWIAQCLMDSFDMEQDFRNKRYNPNRETLKNICDKMGISTNPPKTAKEKYQPWLFALIPFIIIEIIFIVIAFNTAKHTGDIWLISLIPVFPPIIWVTFSICGYIGKWLWKIAGKDESKYDIV